MATDDVRFEAVIKLREPEQRRFWGTAYIHTSADGEQVADWSGHVVDTPETAAALEDAFYKYVQDSRSGDDQHEVFDAAEMIEGFVVTKDKKAAGIFPTDMAEGVYIGFQCRDTPAGDVLWEGIKSGDRTALSIVGTGVLEDI